MGDDLLAFGLKTMKDYAIVTGGDVAKNGIMSMKSPSAWKCMFDFMAQVGLA